MFYKRKNLIKKILIFILVFLLAIIVLFPFYWMIISSFRTNAEIFSTKLNLLPTSFIKENYVNLFLETGFPRWMFNSLIVTLVTTILALFFSVFAGFAFAKYRFFARDSIFLIIFLMISVPRFATIIPLYKLMSTLNLINTHWAMILPFAVNPFAIFLMRQFIKSIPDELLDSARVDGTNELQLVIHIVMPILKPALGAAGIFIILMSWNDYLFPLIMITKPEMMLLPTGLASFKTLYRIEYGLVMAGSFLSLIPIIIGFLLLQRQFIAGLTEGSLKG